MIDTKQSHILIVEDDALLRQAISLSLKQSDYHISTASNGREALESLENDIPDLILSDMMMPEMNGLDLLKALRENPNYHSIPVILLTARNADDDIIQALDLGADDYITKPFDVTLLRARIRSKLNRRPVPITELVRDYRTHLFTYKAFLSEFERELTRAQEWNVQGCLAALNLHELEIVQSRFGDILSALSKQLAVLIAFDGSPIELICFDESGTMYLLMPEIDLDSAKSRLMKLEKRIAKHEFIFHGEKVYLTPSIGYVPVGNDLDVLTHLEHAQVALGQAISQLDLDPKPYLKQAPKGHSAPKVAKKSWWQKNSSIMVQIAMTIILGWIIPFMIYAFAGWGGFELASYVYILVVIALLFTATLIWIEGYLSLKTEQLPEITRDYPLASMIIPAYLPNEAATIRSTLEACFAVDYPSPIQVILAYNTPRRMPIEEELRALTEEYPNFMVLCVEGSTSKAQNVNSALSHVTGEIVAIYDADHQPARDAFQRAWAWISNGYDIVQGHCLIRNGDINLTSQIVAVEFEAIYALSHPGRARLHKFGIFGGSNGYWRTELLRSIRMQGFMLTEDIDSSMRVIQEGFKIKSDRDLISRELAPTTWDALWNQRMRWAQGWYQVTIRHGIRGLFRSKLSFRQKLGFFQLLVWREVYPWISVQIIPIVFYWAWKFGGFDKVDWFVPIFVVTSLVTFGTGPGQIFYILRLGHPSILKQRTWILKYLLFGFFYTEYKNLIGRVAQIKEIMGERNWKTTPRT